MVIKYASVPSENPDDESFRTFVLHNEDHTLGNSLRYIIMKNPAVEFCGYSIPHPSENKINLRIQARVKKGKSQSSTTDILKQGFSDLHSVADHILNTFEEKIAKHKRRHPEPMDTT